MANDPIYCLSFFHVKKEFREQCICALLQLLEPTRNEPGCLQYELSIDNENQHLLIMVEKFVNQEALHAHEQQPYIKHFVENSMNKYCDQVSWNVAMIANAREQDM